MKTKFFTFFTALALSAGQLCAGTVEIDGINYNLNETDLTAEVGNNQGSPKGEWTLTVTFPSSVKYNGKIYSVTSIGKSAFSGCKLDKVYIPASVTSIGDYAFYGCIKLETITIRGTSTELGEKVFHSTKWHYNLPDGPVYIGKSFYGFEGDDYVSFTFEAGTWQICPYAFEDRFIPDIPNSVTLIGKGAFYGCYSYTPVTIPNSVTRIRGGAFANCNLKSVTISNSLTRIEDGTFFNCGFLTSVIIPNSVTHIGKNAFYGCQRLTSVTIPASVTSIESGAFYSEFPLFTDFLRVDYTGDLTDWCGIEFGGYDRLRQSQPGWADRFRLYINQVEVTDLVIPESVQNIKNYAFYDCDLKSITIPASVTSIGDSAFYVRAVYVNSPSVPVTCLAEIPPKINKNSFLGFSTDTLCVPCSAIEAYQADELWSKSFSHITCFTDAIENVVAIEGVFARAGKIVVEGYAQCDVSVYDLTGRLVTQRTNVTNCTLEVPKGTYIVRKGKEVGKVMVP